MPVVTADLRRRWEFEEKYLESWSDDKSENKIKESAGKSGSNFLFSKDFKFMAKSLLASEFVDTLNWMKDYYIVIFK